MKTKLFASVALACLAMLNLQLSTAFGQGTAFTYQGRLAVDGNAAGGIYDLRFTIYDSQAGGAQQGAAITNSSTTVSGGLFAVTLDFGAGVFTGPNRWLEIAVRTNGGGAFTALEPRQALTPSPYAIRAASADSVPATNLSGALTLAQLPAAVVTNGASGVNLTGQFSGPIAMYGGASQVYDLGYSHGRPVQVYLQNQDANGLAWVFTKGPITNSFLEFDLVNQQMRSTLSLSASNFAGGGETLTNISLASTLIPPFTRPPRGIANWLQYWAVPGNTTNTGPEEPGEAIAFKSILEMSTNGMVATGNNWLRIDYGWIASGVVNSNKFPSGMPYLVAFAHSNHCKVQIDFSWELDVSTDRIGDMVRQILGFGADGVGLVTDIGHYPSRPTMTEFRELIRLMNEARLMAGAQYQRGGAVNHSPALWVSINHNATNYFVPPEMQAVNFFAFDAGVPKYSTLQVADNIRTNYLDLAWLTAPGRYPHCNGNEADQFAGTNMFRQWLSALAIADCGFWVTDATATNRNYLPYLTNQAFYAWFDDPASHGGSVVATSGLTEIWRRPIGEPSSGTNLFLFINAATNGDATFTLNVADWPGGVSNRAYVLHDVWLNQDVAIFTNARALTLSQTNMFLAAVYPQGTLGNFVGDGSRLTGLNAASLMGSIPVTALTSVPAENLTGVVADARLSANVALRNSANVFTETNRVAGVLQATNANNQFAGSFSGNGAGLTNLPLASVNGPLTSSRIPNLDAAKITGGTLADARLSPSVARRDGGNTFHGDQVVLNGNIGLGTTAPQQKLDVQGNIFASGTVTPNSDRGLQTGFATGNPAEVLAKVARLPIQQWRFKTEPDEVKHFGPTAQDFHAAFGLGAIPTGIATVDADGVALAAIQGLNQKLEQKEMEITELKARLARIERLMEEKIGRPR